MRRRKKEIIERRRRIRKNERLIAGDLYWNSCKAAEHLGIGKTTLLGYCKNGLSHLKLGNIVMFKREWLDAYIEERTRIQTYREAK